MCVMIHSTASVYVRSHDCECVCEWIIYFVILEKRVCNNRGLPYVVHFCKI